MKTYKKIFLEQMLNIPVLSSYPSCNFLDHFFFRDALSGYNFTYPSTSRGGLFTTSTYFLSVIGGPIKKTCFQDFCNESYLVPPIRIFCDTSISFVLSGLDESTSKITKILYDFNDGTPIKEVIANISIDNIYSPKNINVTHNFYPTERLTTVYNPVITVIKDNSCTSTYYFTLCSFKCGILDIYEKTSLLDARETLISSNILVVLENKEYKQLFNTLLLTNEVVYALPSLSTLPNTIEPVPPAKNVPTFETTLQPITTLPVVINPIKAPPPTYTYQEGPGINLTPDEVSLLYNELMQASNTSITLGVVPVTAAPTLPYFSSGGIIITVKPG